MCIKDNYYGVFIGNPLIEHNSFCYVRDGVDSHLSEDKILPRGIALELAQKQKRQLFQNILELADSNQASKKEKQYIKKITKK